MANETKHLPRVRRTGTLKLVASLPLSPAQSLFEASQLPASQGINVEQLVCNSREKLDLEAFHEAWQTVVDAHPVLRLGIQPGDNGPRQEFRTSMRVPFAVEDLRTTTAADVDGLLENWLEQDRRRSFALAKPPLMRVAVLRLPDDAITWVWTFHHILLDGRAIFLVLDDLFACYEAIRAGQGAARSGRPPFEEFLDWHKSWLATHQPAAESFWRNLYVAKDGEANTELGIRTASAPLPDYRQEILSLPARPELSPRLHAVAAQLGVSINTIIQGAWALLMSRYYRSRSVTFTTIRACRKGSVKGAETSVGVLMNTLPVHARVSEGDSVAGFLQGIGAQQKAARAFQWTPWNIVRGAIPLFASRQLADSCVLYERYDLVREMEERFGNSGARTFAFHERVNIPLILSVSERPEVRFELRYQSAAFTAEDMQHLAASFLSIVEEIVEKSGSRTGELTAFKTAAGLSPAQAERRRRYNDTFTGPARGLLHAGFFAKSKTQPDQLAVDDPARRLTYGELSGYAYSVARRLDGEGIAPGTLVAVVMEKGWQQIAAVLGILRSGAAYLPIDPAQPKARLEYLLANAGVGVVLTQETLRASRTWPSGIKVWTVEENFSPDPFEEKQNDLDALAYVIYTSGSTGQPKGVMITHSAALNTNVDINHRLGVTSADRVLAVSALTFDLSVYDVFGVLEAGGAIVMPAPDRARDAVHWLERIRECGVTVWNSAPALMQMLVTVLETTEGASLPALRWAMMSGDWIPVDLPARLRRFAPNCEQLSLGGATEVSIWSIAFPIGEVDPSWTSIPYGMPLANQTIHVLGEDFTPCPEMASGEIFIGGVGLALGYWGDPAKTAERFVTNPLTGERLYRTGDFGRFRAEGFVEFLGRKDTQVKIRGHRIEIGEIEAAMQRLDGQRESAALTIKDARGNHFLVGCIVPEDAARAKKSDPAAVEGALRTMLTEWLPAHMIPTRIIVLDQMPLSANGKIDRTALQEMIKPLVGSSDDMPGNQPKDLLERAIWNIWRDILPGQRIGTQDGFYDLGGDSFTMLRMMARVHKYAGRPIGLHSLRGGGRIVDLAAAIRATGPVVETSLLNCLHAEGTRPKFFFAHGDLGNSGLYCQRLARVTDPDQPLYTLAPHGIYGGNPPATYTEIAADYVRLIREAQPQGPYHLGGYCNGAHAMYEATRQLQADGETVATLVLLDPPDLNAFAVRGRFLNFGRLLGLTGRVQRATLGRLAQIAVRLQYHCNARFILGKLWAKWVHHARRIKDALRDEAMPEPTEMLRLNNAYVDLIAAYDVPPLPDSRAVWIILRENDPKLCAQQKKRWSPLVPDATYAGISGDHLELKTSVTELAAIIQRAIDAAAK